MFKINPEIQSMELEDKDTEQSYINKRFILVNMLFCIIKKKTNFHHVFFWPLILQLLYTVYVLYLFYLKKKKKSYFSFITHLFLLYNLPSMY